MSGPPHLDYTYAAHQRETYAAHQREQYRAFRYDFKGYSNKT
jgi:hypothetical protein